MEQEILKLKGETTKPEVKPSKMDKDTAEDGDRNDSGTSKKKKGPKRSKTEHLKINATVDIQPDKIPAGLSVSHSIHTDDTGARHDGKNGYCTHIGNELFAWFSSTESKSRINFLSCLGQGSDFLYVLNAGAFTYMEQQKLPRTLLARVETKVVSSVPLAHCEEGTIPIETAPDWEKGRDQHAIKSKRHRRIITEGALMGGLLAQGIPVNLSIVSDDAGQFNVFDPALCWIHAERLINRLIALNDEHINAVDAVREQLWQLYRDLKAYQLEPTASQAEDIRFRFQTMCSTKTAYATLNQVLKRMGNNQHELLRVLDKPYLPLHNNLSERDIRDTSKNEK